jgi:hypothetical protein
MNSRLIFLGTAMFLALTGMALAQDAKETNGGTKPKAARTEKPKLTQEELEAKFKTTLTDATMSGRWCMINKGKLTPEKDDKYTIVSVSKLQGDSWVLRARIQYGKVDMVAPIPIQVKWAGDTPVMIVDNLKLGEGAAYSARVLVYENTYAGTWSADDHGGLLNGVITQKAQPESKE